MINSEQIESLIKCYHCGEPCTGSGISSDDKDFCCTGCKTVYEILTAGQLTSYYSLSENPGVSQKGSADHHFDYLDDPGIQKKLIDFNDYKTTALTLNIPQMHCSSCIYLLENLHKLNSAITGCRVNFLKKQLFVKFNNELISLKEVVQLISSIGYEPEIRLNSIEEKKEKGDNKKLYLKLGIAAFCFGNIMLLSFPEYMSISPADTFFRKLFSYLNFILTLPVFFYSSSDYFRSAYRALKKKIINLDVPLSLGIVVLFGRTAFEIFTNTGAGYADSLAGLLFFLLLGKIFQAKTYDSLNFERNYKSYFPLAVLKKEGSREVSIPVSNLKPGNRIIIRHNEIIPADSILFNGEGKIDYSFVTGESAPVPKVSGEIIYAGGRQLGGIIELEVIKEVSQSYLTQLWNNDTFNKVPAYSFTQFSNTVSRYFTAAIIFIAFVSALLWLPDYKNAFNAFTAVLIVACPCALALSTPFTLGSAMRILGRNKFYVKNTQALEDLSKINTIVFDKTGTITETSSGSPSYHGTPLNAFEASMVKSLAANSTHPLSKSICAFLQGDKFDAADFSEIPGEGIEGFVLGYKVRLGSKIFTGINYGENNPAEAPATRVTLTINDEVKGYFSFSGVYRKNISDVIKTLSSQFKLFLLSGDNEGERKNLAEMFTEKDSMFFRQSPADKLNFISELQDEGKNVLMVGDGLNDAGALSKSNTGIAVTEDISSFTPACDVIMEASVINRLPDFISFSRASAGVIKWSFIISSVYNIIGISFAAEAMLTPVIAAILMPLSSISMVVYTSVMTNYLARKRGL